MNSTTRSSVTEDDLACSNASASTPGNANALDVALVRELLESAERRHRRISEQVVEFGDDPNVAQFPVRDARRHDFELMPVALVSSKQQRKASASSSSNRSKGDGNSASVGSPDSSADSGGDAACTAAWRGQLQLHVVHLLQRLRARPSLLQDFLLVNYEDEVEESARRWLSSEAHAESEDESDDDEGEGDESGSASGRHSVAERLQRRERVRKKRVGKNFAKLRFVFSQLHRAAVVLGEQLFGQVRSMVRRSVASGVLNSEANLVRLESIYKLELRRHVTIEKLLNSVKAQEAERRRKKRRKKRDEQHVRAQTLRRQSKAAAAQGSSTGAEVVDTSAQPVSQPYQSFWDSQHTETEPVKSVHFFRMHALERVLAAERRHPGSLFQHQSSFATGTAPHRLVSEQTEELIHEKLMAFIYNKSRETFPVWKEPPESTFTREETLRQLKRLLPILMTAPLFGGLSVEQLIEFARVTKWRTHSLGAKVLTQGVVVEELVVVMDGKLEMKPQSPSSYSEPTERATEQHESASLYDAEIKRANLPFGAVSTHFGELGMLSKTEVWKTTLYAKSSSVKTLVLSRVAFDTVLQKLFGGAKGRQVALLGAQPQRPSSSPASSARGLAGISSVRPLTAVAQERVVALSTQVPEQLVLQSQGTRTESLPSTQTHGEVASKASRGVTTHHGTSDGSQMNSDALAAQRRAGTSAAAPMSRRPYSGTAIQHYPSFAAPTAVDPASGSVSAHVLRLKWAQPIAFQMEPLDALVANEWAPAFPHTSAMVDFLSPSSLASACLLFEKKSVLVKDNLRSVCFHHQFLGSTYRPPSSDDVVSSSVKGSDRVDVGSTAATGSDPQAASSAAGQQSASENGQMTLSQFSEARRASGASRRRLHVSTSMHNLASPPSSSTFTVMKLGQMPFSRSSFVSEKSFYPDRRGILEHTRLSPNNEDDDSGSSEGDDGGGDDDDDDDELVDATRQDSASPTDARDEDDADQATRARKLALDSLMLSISTDSPRKSTQLDKDTAQEIIVKKYLRAANAHDAAAAAAETSPARSPRRTGVHHPVLSSAAPNGINAGVHNAHAPLPLRVELQRRMEVVLAALKMKPKAKLDLVLKYTHADHYDRFQMAVVLWEQALHYITKRETALANLWKFELVASDPRRHFRSLSTHRLTEQKERDALFFQLNYTTDVCREALAELEKQCGDRVFFDDRTYAEKMKKDYTELLFDVEQERLRMIYNGVQPSVASNTENRSGSQGTPATPVPPGRLGDAFAHPETPSRRRKSFGDGRLVSTTSLPSERRRHRSSNNNDDDEGEEIMNDEQPPSQAEFGLAGSTAINGARNRLANPQESIYVCIAEREEQRTALAKQQEQELEEKGRRRRSSAAANHRMALQVKLQRQTELDELTRRLQAEKNGGTGVRGCSKAVQSVSPDEVRSAQSTTTTMQDARASHAANDLALLQRALHRFIQRPKD